MPNKDREIIRSLAKKLLELAHTEENENKRKRWYKHNALEKGMPMILCSPEGAWTEILTEKDLQCEEKWTRDIEHDLKVCLYAAEVLKDDGVIDPYWYVNYGVGHDGFGVQVKHHTGENRGSFTWDPPITDIARDFELLHKRNWTVNRDWTKERDEKLDGLFGDILPVKYCGQYWWTLGLTQDVIYLIGLEQFMLYMYDCPDELHKLMAFMRDDCMNMLDFIEKEGVVLPNNYANGIASGGVGLCHELDCSDNPYPMNKTWGFSESQETVGVSPEMFGEFIFPYQTEILERFGLNCYGCCEAVHSRWDYLKKIPNLRRMSVSPWCDQNKMAEYLGKNVIFSRKPNPTQVCASFDEDEIRQDLRTTLTAAKDNVLEIILKDTHTVQNKPQRLARWVEIAKEETEKMYR